MNDIYVDHAATTPMDPRVLEAMTPFLTFHFGNPSSTYPAGNTAREAINKAKSQVAALINATPEEVHFTSGGTEADNLALKGYALANRTNGRHIIVSSIEHHAVLHSAESLRKHGFEVSTLPVDGRGRVDPQDVKKALRKDTILVSIMHANNEVGTVQDISEIGHILKEAAIIFHTDAVQTVGSIPVDVMALGVDMLSLSAHKFYGPKGIGALFVRKEVKIYPLLDGGTQEQGLRAGTENVPAIVGIGVAAQLAKAKMASHSKHARKLRDLLIEHILQLDQGITLNGDRQKRLPGNISVCLGKIHQEESLRMLSSNGIYASSGSACNSHALKPSHVLTAMGISPDKSMTALRFTLGRSNEETEVEQIAGTLSNIMITTPMPPEAVSNVENNSIPTGNEEKQVISLDARGLYCPMPVLKTREVFDSVNIGDTLQVIADDPAAESDLRNWVRFTGQKILEVQRQGSEICISIEKMQIIP